MMASGIHDGPMNTLVDLVKAILIWIDQNDYTIAGPVREQHLSGRPADPDINRIVEMQIPIMGH